MFTYIWKRKFSQMAQRLQTLEATRRENLSSTDLSAQTLETAPEFWQRQHEAFCYVDKQLRKVNRQTRIWGSMALLAVLADAALVVGGFTAFQAYRQYQANQELLQLAIPSVADNPLDPAIKALSDQLVNPDPAVRQQALNALNSLISSAPIDPAPFYSGQLPPPPGASSTDMQLQAIEQLGQSRTVEAVPALLAKLSDPSAMVREAAARSLGNIGSPIAQSALENLLLSEESDTVRQAAIWSIAQIFTGNPSP